MYYRLIEKLPNRTPLGFGYGAARWNLPGTPLIYACKPGALNYLEMLSIKGASVTTSTWELVTLEVTGEIPRVAPDSLPSNWKRRPYPTSTQEIGTQWAQEKLSLCLKVPSCRISLSLYPQEHNLLINPLHPDFSALIKPVKSESISFEINVDDR
ncbi:MAG: RES family NAD+ phosphorylase [Candidatus Cyclobacteriaceae bacterium M3_2C_046]